MLSTDQVATAPCTDPIQAYFLIFGGGLVREAEAHQHCLESGIAAAPCTDPIQAYFLIFGGGLVREAEAHQHCLESGIVAHALEFRTDSEPNQPIVAFVVELFEQFKHALFRSESEMDDEYAVWRDVLSLRNLLQHVE